MWYTQSKKNIPVATGVVAFVSPDTISQTLLCKLFLHGHTYISDNTNRDSATHKISYFISPNNK